jgi:leucyl-tRNA synthetase
LTILDEVELAVQINGKVRDRIVVPRTMSNEEVEQAALASDRVQKHLSGGQSVRKAIVVPGRIVNLIIK